MRTGVGKRMGPKGGGVDPRCRRNRARTEAVMADGGGDFVGSLAAIWLGFVGALREEAVGIYMGQDFPGDCDRIATDFDPIWLGFEEDFVRERLMVMTSPLASSVGPTWQ